MIQTNADAADLSLVAKGREFLERGEISSAVECYGQAFDPDALDEQEARSMLIEARSHLSRKHIWEALECFEEALVMGTEVQRRQALEGITRIGEIIGSLNALTTELKRGLKQRLGKKASTSFGLALISDTENLIVISEDALAQLPTQLSRASRISKLPQHLTDQPLPLPTRYCIPYTNAEDLKFIFEVASQLAAVQSVERNGSQ